MQRFIETQFGPLSVTSDKSHLEELGDVQTKVLRCNVSLFENTNGVMRFLMEHDEAKIPDGWRRVMMIYAVKTEGELREVSLRFTDVSK